MQIMLLSCKSRSCFEFGPIYKLSPLTLLTSKKECWNFSVRPALKIRATTAGAGLIPGWEVKIALAMVQPEVKKVGIGQSHSFIDLIKAPLFPHFYHVTESLGKQGLLE